MSKRIGLLTDGGEGQPDDQYVIERLINGVPKNRRVRVGKKTVMYLDYSAAPEINVRGVDEIRVTLAGDFAPTFVGAVDADRFMLVMTQDEAGNRLVTLPGDVRYNTDITEFTATVTAGKADRLGLVYDAAAEVFDLIAVLKGIG